RGRDLRAAKAAALDHCAEFGLTVILVPAVERGVNEHEIGPIVRFGMAHPAVKGVAFQPVTHSGRHVPFDPTQRVTNADVIHALAKLWSASAFAGSRPTDAHFDRLGCAACGIDRPAVLDALAEKVFMIVTQDFQDAYTLNVKQLMKCCVEEITPDGRIIPFCAYNSVGYREQVREELSGTAVPTLVPNSVELQPVLITTRYGS